MKMSVRSLQLANKAYFSDITVKNVYQSFTHKMAAKASWHRNYVTVTLCIVQCYILSSTSMPDKRRPNSESISVNCSRCRYDCTFSARSFQCWWRSTVVEHRSLTGELSLSCARPAADGWPLMWVNHPLQVRQLGQLSLSSFLGR